MADQNMKTRNYMYSQIISQLQNDGYGQIAQNLINQVKPDKLYQPSSKLFEVYKNEIGKVDQDHRAKALINQETCSGLDLEFDPNETEVKSPQASTYETCYVTSHKGPCRAAVFSKNGLYIATGSVDYSIKILDVERMLAKNTSPTELAAMQATMQTTEQLGDHPVIRTLYDHSDEVTCLDFHPFQQIAISGSRDYTVKVFDYSKSTVKRSIATINEVAKVRSVAVHPTGDFLLVGTYAPILRVYDLATQACFVSPCATDHHKGPINTISYAPRGNLFCSGSQDGDIKLWDGRSGRNVHTYKSAHNSQHVSSVQFSRNGKYVLSSGKDSICKLWDLSMPSNPIQVYTGADLSGNRQIHRTQAVFNHNEDLVMFPNEETMTLCCWCARTGERQQLLSLGHQAPARRIAHSPTNAAFITCSEDHRARFWFKRPGCD